MAKQTGDVVYTAKEAFTTVIDGEEIRVFKGDHVREGHPLLNGRADLFEPMKVKYDVEQATAAPGEKRRR